jgi:hypothetical protein
MQDLDQSDLRASRAYEALTAQVDAETVAGLLPAATETEQRIIRSIVLHNILTGRVGGLMQSGRIAETVNWVEAYVPRVSGFFQTERAAWSDALGSGAEALYTRLLAICRRRVPRIRDRYPHAAIDISDLTHQAFDLLLAKHRLRDYAFDEPLSMWLSRAVMCSARALYGVARGITTVSIDENFNDLLPEPLIVNDAPAELSGAIALALRHLSAFDRRLVQLLGSGVPIDEIALRMGKGRATIYRRRIAIFARLRTLLA